MTAATMADMAKVFIVFFMIVSMLPGEIVMMMPFRPVAGKAAEGSPSAGSR